MKETRSLIWISILPLKRWWVSRISGCSCHCIWANHSFICEDQWAFPSGVGNLRQACHTLHANKFLMARRSYRSHISVSLWFSRKVCWPWLVSKNASRWHTEWFETLMQHTYHKRLPAPALQQPVPQRIRWKISLKQRSNGSLSDYLVVARHCQVVRTVELTIVGSESTKLADELAVECKNLQ